MEESKPDIDTRQARREEKRRKKRAQVKKHGKNLARVYMDAILKRLRGGRGDKEKEKQILRG